VSITTLLLAQSSFFAAGNNNAISSIDLSNAYNGISGYNITLVGLLVFLSNWAAPVYWSLFGVRLLKAQTHGPRGSENAQNGVNPNPKANSNSNSNRTWVQKEREHLSTLAPKAGRGANEKHENHDITQHAGFRQHLALLTLWMSASLMAVMLACTALRSHLFVWSVFSPKYLMQVAWAVGFHLGVQGALGAVVWAL
jgi:ethanolaminephosphotransferase